MESRLWDCQGSIRTHLTARSILADCGLERLKLTNSSRPFCISIGYVSAVWERLYVLAVSAFKVALGMPTVLDSTCGTISVAGAVFRKLYHTMASLTRRQLREDSAFLT